jgi:hypothetical protein
MVTQVKTIDFLPEIFKTKTNEQFLSATLDQLVQQPEFNRIQGYIGSKFGYGVSASDRYLVEPTKIREDYQLEPGVIFTKKDTSVAVDLLTYPGILDSLKLQGGNTQNNSSLFQNQFYSWDSFVDLDKLINYSQYYWLPNGPDLVTITNSSLYKYLTYTVANDPTGYTFTANEVENQSVNPEITVLRGGSYEFVVDQDSDFYIQSIPGVSGVDPRKKNVSSREVYGVVNNGTNNGTVKFNVPLANAQDEWNYPGDIRIDMVTTLAFNDIEGKRSIDVPEIDGVYDINGKTLLFYGSKPGAIGNITEFFDGQYDINDSMITPAATITITATNGTTNVITCNSTSLLSVNEVVSFGAATIGGIPANGTFYVKSIVSATEFTLSQEPNGAVLDITTGSGSITAVVDQGLFEDSTTTEITKHYYKVNFIGNQNDGYVIRLTEQGLLTDNTKITINYGTEFIGRNFVKTSLGEIKLIPPITAPLERLYYQDSKVPGKFGVIKIVDQPSEDLIDVLQILGRTNYISPNGVQFTNGLKVQFVGNIFPDSYTKGSFYVEGVGTGIQLISEFELNVPEPFGQAVTTPFDDTAYDQTAYGETLFAPVDPDYITIARNSTNKNAWSRSNRWFHIDVLNESIKYNRSSPISLAAIGNPNSRAKRPIVEFYPNLKLFNTGTASKKPVSFINFTVTDALNQVAGQASFQADGEGSEVYNGATIIFAGDTDINVRTKIFEVQIAEVEEGQTPVITLSEAPNGKVEYNDQTVVLHGENYAGYSFYFDGLYWTQAQYKNRINQPPKFDIIDSNGYSFGDTSVYPSTTFDGCTLFQYAIGSGADDPILLFPIKYSSVNNIGDIVFDVTLNSQNFDYISNNQSLTKPVSDGYVYNYRTRTDYTREIGWQTTVGESFQYQVFEFKYEGLATFTCDIKVKDDSVWPKMVVYVNNSRTVDYTYATTANTTVVTITKEMVIGESVVIMLDSDQASSIAYYQIPNNLDHNPFNEELTSIALGDVRGHFKSICNNVPGLVGAAFGPNNYRDLGNVVPYGTRIIQNSAPIVNAAAFLRNNNNNFFDALQFNSTQYINFKTQLVDTLAKNEFIDYQNTANLLDEALDIMTQAKVDTNAFFWSDMLPSKNAYKTSNYVFKTDITQPVFKLTKVYDFSKANYNGVLVYLSRKEGKVYTTSILMKDIDYTVSSTEPSLIVTKPLVTNDIIIVKEYNQTYGSFVPNTPTKLGLYPSFIPQVVYDTTYVNPTYFIQGHDGSYNKLYGTYENGQLSDYRDRVLLEFETRIYNNLKVSAKLPIGYDEVVPGQFRNVGFDYQTYNVIYSTQFLNWVGQNRINFETHVYDSSNPDTYNYKGSFYNFNKKVIQQGNWKGIYLWLYDTPYPDIKPWEMLGLVNKPSWWDSKYGVAPYTSDNLIMWTDIATGYIWNDGDAYVNPYRIRDGLLDIIPVDSNGQLKNPFESVVGSYDTKLFTRNWGVGDVGPTEYSYLKSSTWPFDLMRIMALMKPAKFFSYGIDVDHYKYNAEFNQYLYNNRYRDSVSTLTVYGNGHATNSYINWMVDYLCQFGINGSDTIDTLIKNLDVRLTYRLAGFSDKDLLNFYVQKGTTTNNNNSLLIPDDSFSLMLYENQPTDTLVYSSIIVQQTETGYKVYGNSQSRNYFVVKAPMYNGLVDTIQVNSTTVTVPKNYYEYTLIIEYGHEFASLDELSAFIRGYGLQLISQGFEFGNVENGLELNWDQMIAETIYWAITGWGVGSTVNVNPNARSITIDSPQGIVQPLTIQQENFVLNQNLIPIAISDLYIYRNNTQMSVKALNEGDALSFLRANISTIEHCVVFDNKTVFNDTLFNLVTGLRQQRIYVKGQKTAEWTGQMNASGFILNQDNIKEWQESVKYTKGTIVKFKNDYYMANVPVILPSNTFDYTQWLKTSYEMVQKGLLPNPSTRAYEALKFYDTNNPNLESDADLLGFSLIGFRPRQYMASANLDDSTQVNVYKNMLPAKGTVDGVTKLQGINLQQNELNYNIHENWAIKTTEFGGILNQNFVDFTLNENLLTGNPSIVSIIKNEGVDGAQQQLPLQNIKNFARPINTTEILPTLRKTYEEKLPSAGYVNLDDVKQYGYDLNALPDNTISEVYKNDYLWVADKDNTWQIFTPLSLSAKVVSVVNNLNGTATVLFDKPHGLYQNQSIGILGFDSRVDGYHLVDSILTIRSIIAAITLDPFVKSIDGTGICYLLQSQRVVTARDIPGLPLLNGEWTQNKIWVDQNQDGNWSVYEKTNNYSFGELKNIGTTVKFGTSVAYVPDVGYFVGDAAEGKLYHFAITDQGFYLRNTIQYPNTEFGLTITRSNDLLIVSAPNELISQIYVYRIPTAKNINSLTLQQVITVSGGRVGDAMDISGDSNLLYIGAKNDNAVVAFQRDKELTFQSVGIRLAQATQLKTTFFVCEGDVVNSIKEGQRVNYITNYADTTAVVSQNVNEGSFSFRVSGDKRSTLATGDKVAFNNTGITSTSLYTIATKSYDSVTNTTVFYTVEMFYDYFENPLNNVVVTAGSKVYKVTFSNDAIFTVITGSYDVDSDTTTFYTLEEVYYTAPAGAYVYTASTNFTLVGLLDTVDSNPGDNFGASVATNYDGSKVFIGAPNTDYDVSKTDVGYTYVFDRIDENIEVQYDQNPYQFYVIFLPWYPTNQTRIYVNGDLLSTGKYVLVLNVVIIGTINLRAGDIVTVSSARFVLMQKIAGWDNLTQVRSGEQFGFSLDCNKYGSELIVGAPFDVTESLTEGTVIRYTNEGKRYGTQTGLIAANLTDTIYLLLNGFRVQLTPGNAASIANQINQAMVTNIFAYSTEDGRLVIRLRDERLGQIGNKLNLAVFNVNDFYQLGFTSYIKTQTIQDSHPQTVTQFGYAVKFNDENSFVVGAPAAIRYSNTTFDLTDDNNKHNDTVFDNALTDFVDGSINAGAVYMYDYIESYNENLTNAGKYIYAQACNDQIQNYGSYPMYGQVLSFNDGIVMVGAPNFDANQQNGRVIVYTNQTKIPNWHLYRESDPIVDVEKIQRVQMYDNRTNVDLIALDYIDPLQGKLLGVVRQELDFISMTDPASYNGNNTNTGSRVWGLGQVGKLWFDTSKTRFLNYHQNDVVYNSQHWGKVFPGSDVAVYSWIESNVIPAFYEGSGTPYDLAKYSVTLFTDSNGALIARYYYWVRNTNTLFAEAGKKLSDSVLERYIADPTSSGITYMGPLKPNTFGLYNAGEYVNDVSTNLHLGFGNNNTGPASHQEFQLIRSEYPDDFLPGFPDRNKGYTTPVSLYDRYLDSFSGTDETGAQVPDPYLPKLLQLGINVRPRQGFFANRLGALQNYFEYANNVLRKYPISEFENITFLTAQGTFFDTAKYWETVYWWADGYSDSTKATLEVPTYTDLLTLTAKEGQIVGVISNAQGKREVYRYSIGTWTRIGLEDGTIQFLDTLWDYNGNKIGFGDDYYDNAVYDFYPSVETRYAVRALNEQIYVGTLLPHRNLSLTLMFEYIQSESLENQNYLPWLTKTSFADVSYTVRELTQNQRFQRDNEQLLEGYINEVKPYRVVMKEFFLRYNRTDVFAGNLTDFDLPAVWDDNIGKFVSPQLTYKEFADTPYQFPTTSAVWSSDLYKEWYSNFGLSLVSTPDTTVTLVAKFVNALDQEIYVESADGLPVTGTITLGDEKIGYTEVDRVLNIIKGVSRGVDGTIPTAHFAGIPVIMNYPEIAVTYSGRGYLAEPDVIAYVDTTKYPVPSKPAVLSSVLSGDKVVSVRVIDLGEGYVVAPEIIFVDSTITTKAGVGSLNFVENTIRISSTDFENGELVYVYGNQSNGIIKDGYYYISTIGINVLMASFNSAIVSLYKTKTDALNKRNRIKFLNDGSLSPTYEITISIRAKAVPTLSNHKVRSIKPTLRFDRTSYRPRVQDWTPGSYYSSPYLSLGNDASSPAKMYIGLPYENMSGVVQPAGGVGAEFKIYNVLLGQNYYAEVDAFGSGYSVGDIIRIPGTSLNGSSTSVYYTATLTNASATVPMGSTSNILAGMKVFGFGIPEDTVVTSVNTHTAITLSNPATLSGFTVLSFSNSTVNDCYIKVTAAGAQGEIDTIEVTGGAADASLASLAGAVLPVIDLNSVDGQAVVTVNYNYSGLKPGQVNGSNMYFYKVNSSYTYDDTGKNFVGSVTGNTLTVTFVEFGKTLAIGDSIYGVNVDAGTTITGFGTGTGGVGTYTLSTSTAVFTGSIDNTTLTVTSVSTGTIKKGTKISGFGVTPGTTIVSFGSGVGGTGTYTISTEQYVASTTITSAVESTNMNTNGGAKIKISRPRFNPYDVSNLYYIQIENFGLIYNDGDKIVIPGSLLGGVDGTNDATITVIYANVDGSIFSATVDGVAQGNFDRFYVKAVSDTELAVYSDTQFKVPVPYSAFIWDGNTPNTDYGYLPEPLTSNYSYNYNLSSIVTYAGIAWQCIVSNNDTDFNPTKWYPLQSNDPALNALDRIQAYYQPTINMPGKDIQQLVKGVTYPNNVYYGNAFAPEDELPLDFVVRDLPFYPADLSIKGIVNNGTTLVAVGDATDHSVVLVRNSTGTWDSYRISEVRLGITDISYSNNVYIMSTENTQMPILVSYDGTSWIAPGYFTPYDYLEFDDGNFDTTQVSAPNISLYASAIINGVYFAVGSHIVRSENIVKYDPVYTFGSRLPNTLKDIAYIQTTVFVGYMAVGVGQSVIAGAGTALPTIVQQARVVTSIDGNVGWTLLQPSFTTNGLNSVTSSSTQIVVVGENATVWYSTNASNWAQGSITGLSHSATLNGVAFGNGVFVAVGDKTGTGSTDPGFIITSVDGITWVERSSQYITTHNLHNVTFSDGYFYATGENDTILRTTNGVNWTDISQIEATDPYYVVKGNDFLYGYGPEELVAGVVSDTLSLYVKTAPGAYWDIDTEYPFWYKHTGFNMVQRYLTPNKDLQVSFATFATNPATLSVFVVNTNTNTGYRIYETTTANSPIGYSVNWITKVITLTGAIPAGTKLLVEVYEVGNGKELIRANSQLLPLTINPYTGNSEFVFDIIYQSIVNEPIVFVNGNKLVYNVDYSVFFTSDNFMTLEFNQVYSNTDDYIVFAILGDSSTISSSTQYGYSIPETGLYVPASAGQTEFALDTAINALGYDNVDNAIVEVNGARLATTEYTLNNITNTLTLDTGVGVNDIVAVTTFNDTTRQFLVTQAYTGKKITKINFIDITKTPVQISFTTNPGFTNGNEILIQGVLGTTVLNGNNYFVKTKVIAGDSNYYYELYTNSGLTIPVIGSSLTGYAGSGYAGLASAVFNVPYPTVDVLKDPMTYTDGTRAWVTVNGNRVRPDMVIYGSNNQMSILAEISSTDNVLVTAMVTGASPNQISYNTSINKSGEASVYRTNLEDGSWLTQEFFSTDDEMHFFSVSNLVDTIVTTGNITEEAGELFTYVQCTLSQVKQVLVYNENTITELASTEFGIRLLNGKPAVVFISGVSAGDSVRVTLVVGNTVEINGERIRFAHIDIANNTISGLTRGVDGTRAAAGHAQYSMGYGINDGRRLSDSEYTLTWNSEDYTTKGDPLQISTTNAALFLQKSQ